MSDTTRFEEATFAGNLLQLKLEDGRWIAITLDDSQMKYIDKKILESTVSTRVKG